MKDAKFTEFTERCLAIGRDGGWEKQIKAKESVAWELHDDFPPTGSLVLANLILDQGMSYLKRDIGTKAFAKELVADAFEATQQLEDKDDWDYYYLGICHAYGRGTKQDYSQATEAFSKSAEAGGYYAEFEAIWARYLAGGSRLDAVLSLTALRGKLADFAAFSARALTLLELGPPKELASEAHIARILLMKRALHDFIYHDRGARQINIAIEKELREGVAGLQDLGTSRGNFALYLTTQASRTNPTDKDPIDWFKDAVDPEIPELLLLCQRQQLGVEELRIIVECAQNNGWTDSELATMAANQLDPIDY